MDRHASLPPIPLWLGLTGWIPFWLPVLSTAHALVTDRSAAAEAAIFVIYAAIILGFLGGVRWGRALAPDKHQALDNPTFVLSIVPSLAGLAAALLIWAGLPLIAFALILVALITHWRWDLAASRRGDLPAWYGQLRAILTAGAVGATLAMLALYPLTG
ncbi:DUF3429 domain-containing protein [Maricaulis maris]|uniref:DUF3429 domain-containing protein n=1 Tax=Maricaulis maris TaxID=74318 RepID=UPI003B8C523C